MEPASALRATSLWYERFPRALPFGIFALVMAITLLSVAAIENAETRRRLAQLEQVAEAAASAIERQAEASSAYLRAGAAVLGTQQRVSGPLFQTYVSQLRLDSDRSGSEGLGWAMRVDTADVEVVEQGMRKFGQRGFTIRPRPTGDRAFAVAVMYLQPDDERNRRALGFDMFSEPVRRAAMIDAQRYARPSASGKVVLAQDDVAGRKPPGFLIYMPVFGDERGKPQLKGFVFTPFNAQAFLTSALAREDLRDFGVSLYDRSVAPANLLARIAQADPSGTRVRRSFEVANHPWVLVIEAPRPSTLTAISLLTLLFGLLVAGLLLAMARILTRQAIEDRASLALLEEQASIRNLLTRELNHRVKNTLANVLSIVSLTRRRATDLPSFAASLEGRIRALSATHDLLTQSEWGPTPILAVMSAELAPYVQDTERSLQLSGPEVELAPNDALSLGLAIHELATNAAKYGALSVPGGKVAVSWQAITADLAKVEWREIGGPPVSQEGRKRGFGTELIEKIVAHELKNPVELVFDPEGVRCSLILPIRRPREFALRVSRGNGPVPRPR